MTREYRLSEPNDSHGQPIRFVRANFENNVSKAIDQLSGLACGILADGVVTEKEARVFFEWVRKFSAYEPIWPFTELLDRINQIFADGIIDPEEQVELIEIMKSIAGAGDEDPSENFSSNLPLDRPQPDTIEFREMSFVITGRFAFGTRRKVNEQLLTRNAIVASGGPTKNTHYLVIGAFASRDWIHANYGRKIERAVELRSEGTGIRIISEETWKQFL